MHRARNSLLTRIMNTFSTSNNKVYLIRHAESEYNLAKKDFMKDYPDADFGHPELQNKVTLSPHLLDCGITPDGYTSLQKIVDNQELKPLNIQLVLVSPLKRALITAQQLFKVNKTRHIIVEPLLAESMYFSCDIGSNILWSKMRFNYDFSFLDSIPYKKLWTIWHFKRRDEILEKIRARVKNEEELHQKGDLILLDIVKEEFPGMLEDWNELVERCDKLKNLLVEKYSKMLQPGESMALVGHYKTFQMFTASKFDEKGDAVDGLKMKNAEIVKWKPKTSETEGELKNEDPKI